jgi:hypothetical protein
MISTGSVTAATCMAFRQVHQDGPPAYDGPHTSGLRRIKSPDLDTRWRLSAGVDIESDRPRSRALHDGKGAAVRTGSSMLARAWSLLSDPVLGITRASEVRFSGCGSYVDDLFSPIHFRLRRNIWISIINSRECPIYLAPEPVKHGTGWPEGVHPSRAAIRTMTSAELRLSSKLAAVMARYPSRQ